MEKLLHERLREGLENLVGGTFLLDTDSGGCVIYGEPARQIADEIERYYIPRPRFEDGEPVQFGDKAADEIFEMGSPVNGMSFYDDGSFSLIGGGSEIEFEKGSFVKRPTPKVCDADGVEITSGTTGWLTDGTKVYVDDVHTDEPSPNGENAPWINIAHGTVLGWCLASDFTYERPVFDAEGVRICKGDTVWDTEEGKRYNVFEPDDFVERSSDIVRIGDSEYIEAKLLTHREPDSLERIKADRELTICEYNAKYQDAVRIGMDDHLLNRAIALIESGAL